MNLNTSNVKVQHRIIVTMLPSLDDLNTSNVKVQLAQEKKSWNGLLYLNTSNVKVQPSTNFACKNMDEFKYIKC